MRRRRKNMGDDDAAVDMTPMLDIVFIMLIFFIVTATFLDERGIDITQPPPPPDNLDIPQDAKPAITIYVNDRNQCAVDSRQTECDRVPLAVERLLAEKPGASIILRIHAEARNELLVELKDSMDSKQMSSKIEVVRG